MGRIADWWFRWRMQRLANRAAAGKATFGRLPDKTGKVLGGVDVKSKGKAVIRAKVIRKDGTVEDLGVVAGNPNIEPL